MNFEAIIGLEIHIEMKTNSKVFSSGPVTFGKTPNTMVVPFDMSFPGTLPTVNREVVTNAIKVAAALNMKISNVLLFDRKNYFYSDLPKGYQITQYRKSLGTNGFLEIDSKKINIQSLHIEEDTCKQIHNDNETLIDYNRAGIPLIEIVTNPDFRSGDEAKRFVQEIKSIVSFLDVSDGKMEEGSLRCDVNLSLRPFGSNSNGSKVEIKNINTLANIKTAINYEINRRQSLLLSGEIVKQETRRFDETKQETVFMRDKVNSIDYCYCAEPNIPPIELSKAFVDGIISSLPELPHHRFLRYKELGLSDEYSNILVSNKNLCDYYDDLLALGTDAKISANWLVVEVQTYLNKEKKSINEFPIGSKQLSKFIQILQSGNITNKQAREIFNKMLMSNEDVEILVKDINTTLLSDEGVLLKIIRDVINDNPQVVEEYKKGKNRVVSYIVGQVMKRTNGNADTSCLNKLIIKELKER